MSLLNDDTRNNDLTNEDILRIIKESAYATELSIKAGYDGIEIHAANNFLVQQFILDFIIKEQMNGVVH